MSVFSQRSSGYKAGVILLFVGFVTFITGFAAPNWTHCSLTYRGQSYLHPYLSYFLAEVSPPELEVIGHNGLWISCSNQGQAGHLQCESISSKSPAWLTAARGLQSLTLIGLAVCCIYIVVVNWVQASPVHNRLPEMIAAVSGLLGLVGVIEYAVKSSSGQELYNLYTSGYTITSGLDLALDRSHVSWALAVDLCGCVFCILAAFVIGIYNQALFTQVVPQHVESYVTQTSTRPQTVPIHVTPRPPPPATNVQVYYTPHTSLPPPSMDLNPPSYDDHYIPAHSSQPQVVISHSPPSDTQASSPPGAGFQTTSGGQVQMVAVPPEAVAASAAGAVPGYEVKVQPPGPAV